MFRNRVPVVLWAAVFGLCAGGAIARDLSPPAELPPAGYKGQQYVDSRGCVYLRAGLGGQVTWVPRVGQDRKAMCGLPPTFGPRPTIEVAEDNAAPVAPATATAAPETTTRTTTQVAAATTTRTAVAPTRVATPRVAASVPAASYVPAPVADTRVRPVVTVANAPAQRVTAPVVVPTVTVAGNYGTGCPADAPVAQRLPLTNGGTVLVCTRGDGSLTGARNPKIWGPVGAAISGGPGEGVRYGSRSAGPAPTVMPSPRYAAPTYGTDVQPQATRAVTVPPGYKAAWEDDRLNPLRGIGTDAGWAAQDQVWATTQPMMLVEDRGTGKRNRGTRETARLAAAQNTALVPVYAEPQYFVAPSAPAPRARSGGALYVQVGSFGDANNAQNTLNRLASMGLPTAHQNSNRLTVVLAGPFGSSSDAQAALGMARSIGFGDAFIR